MQIRICGRLVRLQKPIKLRTLTKLPHHVALVALMAILSSAPALAAAPCDAPQKKIERSSQSLKTAKKQAADNIPAMALAMAFGMRSVHGPVQKTAPDARSAFVSHPTLQKRQAASMSREEGCVLSSSAIMPPRMAAR